MATSKAKLQVIIDADAAKFNKRMKAVTGIVAGVGVAIAGMGIAAAFTFSKIANSIATFTRDLNENKFALNADAKALQAWGIIAANASIETKDLVDAAVGFNDFLRDFQKAPEIKKKFDIDGALTSITRSGGASDQAKEAMEALGLDPDSIKDANPMDQLQALIDGAMKITNDSQRLQTLMPLIGEDDAKKLNQVINSMKESGKTFKETMAGFQDSPTLLSEEDIANMTNLTKEWKLFKMNMENMKLKVFAEMAPQMERMVKAANEFIEKLSEDPEALERFLSQVEKTASALAGLFERIDWDKLLKILTELIFLVEQFMGGMKQFSPDGRFGNKQTGGKGESVSSLSMIGNTGRGLDALLARYGLSSDQISQTMGGGSMSGKQAEAVTKQIKEINEKLPNLTK